MIYFYGEIEEETKTLLQTLFEECFKVNKQNPNSVEMEFSIISGEEMRELNNRTRGVDYATDVLSFPNLEGCLKNKISKRNYPDEVDPETNLIYLGEIVINLDKAKEQAEEYGHSVKREFCYLFVHGVLHLLGYDHIEERDKELMREKEELVLKKYNITRDN